MKNVVGRILWACVTICGLLGLVHTLVTFFIFDHLTQRALYFAGTGLAAIVLALFNIATWRGRSATGGVRWLIHIANGLMAGFALVAIIAVPEPQAYLGAVGFWGLFLAGLLLDQRTRAIAARPEVD